MANQTEIQEAVDCARENGCNELVVLHCVSGYPAPAEQYNLRTITDMAKRFNVLTGLSDHTIGNATAVTSVALGACLIEKHVTLDRTAGGPDDSFSLEPKELAALCQDSKVAWQALGRVNYHITAAEQQNSQFRRSLYVVKDIKEGELFTSDNVKSIRPGVGLAPKHYFSVLGKKASTVIKAGTALTHSLLDL